MSKLKLQIEELAVETFETGDTDSFRGTVRGNEIPTLKTICPGTLLATNPTCCPCTP
ncbi:MAG TPA: hypothetical protein VHG08_09315 [Longimicrobium sp.]|nr:hypothetical protein [Longimicrobium sp.]